jgi:biotin operon repressor
MLASMSENSGNVSPLIRLERLLRLVSLMESGQPKTGEQLADTFKVCKRTVFRDIRLLRTANVPIAFDSISGGYRLHRPGTVARIDSGGAAPMTVRMQNGEVCSCPKIDAEEIVALLLAVKVAGPVTQEIAGPCDIALAKILATALPDVREQVIALLRQCSDSVAMQPDVLQFRPSG